MHFALYWNQLAPPLRLSLVAVAMVAPVQFLLAFGYWWTTGGRLRTIRRLRGRAFSDVPGRTAGFPWLGWVRDRFGTGASSVASREDAVREFDRRQASGWAYLFLSRIGLMAPLFGLLLTAGATWEFQSTRMASLTSADPREVLAEVLPLFVGIAAGAALSLLNQILMILVSMRTAALRSRAMEWFDLATERVRATLPADPLSAAAARIEADAVRLTKATAMLGQAAVNLTAASDSIGKSATGLGQVVSVLAEGQERHNDSLRASAACFSRLEDTTSQLTTRYGELGESASRTVAQLARVAVSWQETTEQSARANEHASELSLRVAESLLASTAQIESAAQGWSEAVDSQRAGLEQLEEIRSAYMDGQSGFAEAVDRFERCSIKLVDKTEAVGKAFDQAGGDLRSFREAAIQFGTAVRDDLAPAAEALRPIREGLGDLIDSTRQVGESTRVLEEVIRGYYRDAAGVAPAVESLQRQIESADAVGRRMLELMERADRGLDSALKGLQETSASFQADVTGASRDLGSALGQLSEALGNNFAPLARDLAGVADPLARLHSTLDGLTALTRALADLPASTTELDGAAAAAAKTLRKIERLNAKLDEFERAIGSAAGRANGHREGGFWSQFAAFSRKRDR